MMRASVTVMNDVLAALEKVFSSLSKFHDLSIVRSKTVEAAHIYVSVVAFGCEGGDCGSAN